MILDLSHFLWHWAHCDDTGLVPMCISPFPIKTNTELCHDRLLKRSWTQNKVAPHVAADQQLYYSRLMQRYIPFAPFQWKTHATVEVHHLFCWAHDLRSSISHPNTDPGLKWKCYRMNNPMAWVYNEKYCNTRLKFRRRWVKESRHSENVSAKNCYLYSGTRRKSYRKS